MGWDVADHFSVVGVAISIHPSRVGWDFASVHIVSSKFEFQSTHPVWDGTNVYRLPVFIAGISIHPSRVGWDRVGRRVAAAGIISIHPSRVGWDFDS